MTRNIKNSSGKIIGSTEILDDCIIINNTTKPLLIIKDKKIVDEVKRKDISIEILILLYNEYTLGIGEIASLYNRCYSNVNKLIKTIPEIKIDKRGRRNRAFGHPVSKEQSEKMSKSLKGRKPPCYERTPEIREKISKSLKNYFEKNPQSPVPHIKNWENGVYDKVDFKRGISGYFTSLKINKTIRFRSLLELYYLLLIEKDNNIKTYAYEPFHIKMENGKSYMPDFLINENILIELKAKKYVERVKGVKEKVLYKESQAIKYCNSHNLKYRIIYDEDIGFESKKMKHYIRNNPDIVKKYNITFTDPKRMVNK